MGVVWVLVKYVAESAWCLLLIRPAGSADRARRAMSFGLVRLLIGREAMLLTSQPAFFSVPEVLLYGVLLAGRWFAWGFLLYVASRSPAPLTAASHEPARIDRRWRMGAVVVSCLADVPALLSGIWVGVLWL